LCIGQVQNAGCRLQLSLEFCRLGILQVARNLQVGILQVARNFAG
jgi:hypothetical protein